MTYATHSPESAPVPAIGHDTEAVLMPPLTAVSVPISRLKAALLCVSKEETRYYLCGVCLHQTADGWVRLAATDGVKLLVTTICHASAITSGASDWLRQGIIIPAENLAARLSMLARCSEASDPICRIAYAAEAPKIEIGDFDSENTFRARPIAGTFPDYTRIIESSTGAFDPQSGDWEPAAFAPEQLKYVSAVAAALDAKSVMLYVARSPIAGSKHEEAERRGHPSVIVFGGAAASVMYLQGYNIADATLPTETRNILAPAIKGHVGALRAHLTRAKAAARKEKDRAAKAALLAKAGEYEARIALVIQRAGSGLVELTAQALGPEATPQPQDNAPEYNIASAIEPDADPATAEAESQTEPRLAKKPAKAARKPAAKRGKRGKR